MQWENPPKIEWQTTLLQEKHRSCILWFSMQSLCWAKARAQPDRPSGAILAAFGRRQPPSGRLGLRPSLPANLPKGPPPPPADPCKPQALARSRPADGFGGRWPPAAPLRGAGSAGPLPAQTYPTGIPRSIGCNCRPSSAAASAAPVRESSAARLVGFFRGSSCPKGTK